MSHSEINENVRHMAMMAEEMDAYLMSDVLFWKMSSGPRLTLGGYLLRQHRVLALADTLDGEEVGVLNTAVSQYNAALHEKIVRFETKAHTEIEARLRQWNEFLSDLEKEATVARGFYANGVETRIMLALLVEKLQTKPYQLQERVQFQVETADRRLRRRWYPDNFILAELWQPAYPEDEFWYLYGMPGKK